MSGNPFKNVKLPPTHSRIPSNKSEPSLVSKINEFKLQSPSIPKTPDTKVSRLISHFNSAQKSSISSVYSDDQDDVFINESMTRSAPVPINFSKILSRKNNNKDLNTTLSDSDILPKSNRNSNEFDIFNPSNIIDNQCYMSKREHYINQTKGEINVLSYGLDDESDKSDNDDDNECVIQDYVDINQEKTDDEVLINEIDRLKVQVSFFVTVFY